MATYADHLRRAVENSDRFARAPLAAQEQFQLAALARLAEHAHRASPFWHERLAAAGWAPGMPFDRAALERLPLLTRTDLQTRYADLKARPADPAWGDIVPVSTSGSTGQPVTVDRTTLQGLQYDTATILNHLWHRRDFSLKLAAVRDVSKTTRMKTWGHPAAKLFKTGPCVALQTRGNDADIEAELDWVEGERPDYLITQPGRLLGLARAAIARGRPGPRLQHVITLGETVTPTHRDLARQAFGAAIKDIYSCRDTGYLALQCPAHEHYHVLSDVVLLETVGSDGKPAAAGEAGNLLVTILHSLAMPIIRYELGDFAVAGPPCDCGLQSPVLSRILGRNRNLARLPDGRLRYVSFPGQKFLQIAPLRDYRLIQRGASLMEVQVECPVTLTAQQHAAIGDFVRDCMGFPIAVEVKQVPRVQHEAATKREEFVRIE